MSAALKNKEACYLRSVAVSEDHKQTVQEETSSATKIMKTVIQFLIVEEQWQNS